MPSKFPILRVPQLVLTEIINQIEPGDLIPLSLCSKNMFRLTQFHRTNAIDVKLSIAGRKDYNLVCTWKAGETMLNKYILKASKNGDQNLETTETVEIANECVPVSIDEEKGCLCTFWVDQVKGFQEMVRHVTKLLKKDIEMVFFDADSLWMMDWIKTVQTGLQVAHFSRTESFTEDQYTYVLENCDANIVMLNAKPPQSFEYKKEFPEKKLVVFEHGFWITVENVLNMKFSYVDIKESKLTTADMNAFLKHWLSGGSPQLKYLAIQIDGSLEALFADLEEEVMPIQNHREFDLNLDYQQPIHFVVSIEICQENGNRATFFYFRSTTTFQMVVGDDFVEWSW